MADPLSITLAAITLAAALKDIVELAQKIEKTFEKVSKNAHELRSLASEIKTTAVKLKQFNDDHHDILCDALDMKVALTDFLTEMRNIYNKCRDMFPSVSRKRMGLFRLALKEWMNRNKIETEIRTLRNRVDKLYSQFMMFAVIRIENRLIVTRRQINETLIQVRQDIATKAPSDNTLLTFMSSNGRISSGIPPEISHDFISDTYLCLQIEAIDEILHRLSSTSNFYVSEEPWEGHIPPYHPVVHNVISYDKTALRQEVILQSLQIRSYLQNDTHNLSIQAGAWSMVDLCNGLYMLNMIQEALTTSKWTVNLFRTLAKTVSHVYLPYLVHSLRIFSTIYAKVGDVDASLAAIGEAVEASRGLQSSFTTFDIKIQFGEALATLAFVWNLKGNKEESLKAAQEGVNIYENALLKNGGLSTRVLKYPVPYVFDGMPDEVIRDYGRALNQLSFSFQALDRLEDAFRTAGEALKIFVSSTHRAISDSHKADVAFMQYRISHQDFHEFIPLEEALSLSEQAVAIYRTSWIKDLEERQLSLYHALWEQANIMGKLGRHEEAVALWKEISKIAKETIADQTFFADALNQLSWSLRSLRRYDEAASMRMETVKVYSGIQTSVDEVAQGYFELGVDLQLSGRSSEAIEAFFFFFFIPVSVR